MLNHFLFPLTESCFGNSGVVIIRAVVIILNVFARGLAQLLGPELANRLIVHGNCINRSAGHSFQGCNDISSGGVRFASDGRTVFLCHCKILVMTPVAVDHCFIEIRHGRVPLGDGGACCRRVRSRRTGRLSWFGRLIRRNRNILIVNIYAIRVDGYFLRCKIEIYAKMYFLCNVTELDVVVSANQIGLNRNLLASNLKGLGRQLGGRTSECHINHIGKIGCRSFRRDQHRASRFIPIYAKASELTEISELEVVIVCNIVAGRVDSCVSNIYGLTLRSRRSRREVCNGSCTCKHHCRQGERHNGGGSLVHCYSPYVEMLLFVSSITQQYTGNNQFKLNVHFQNRAIQHYVFPLQKSIDNPCQL